MPNLEFASPELPQVITCGSTFELPFHVHESGGSNFNWTGYTPKAKLTVGTVAVTVTGTVVSAGGGTATASWTSAQTATLPSASWGSIEVWADADASTTNLAIGMVMVRTSAEVVP